MASTWDTLMSAVKTRIEGLNLTGIEDENIVVQLVADWQAGNGPDVPAILIAPAGAEVATMATNVSDDVMYPVGVAIISAENRDQSTHRERNLEWREQIRREFSYQRCLPAWQVAVANGNVSTFGEWANNRHTQALVLQCTVREGVR